jgi:hypothetical protein
MLCLEKAADDLTGNDYQWYNRIMDAVEEQNHTAFIREVQK